MSWRLHHRELVSHVLAYVLNALEVLLSDCVHHNPTIIIQWASIPAFPILKIKIFSPELLMSYSMLRKELHKPSKKTSLLVSALCMGLGIVLQVSAIPNQLFSNDTVLLYIHEQQRRSRNHGKYTAFNTFWSQMHLEQNSYSLILYETLCLIFKKNHCPLSNWVMIICTPVRTCSWVTMSLLSSISWTWVAGPKGLLPSVAFITFGDILPNNKGIFFLVHRHLIVSSQSPISYSLRL